MPWHRGREPGCLIAAPVRPGAAETSITVTVTSSLSLILLGSVGTPSRRRQKDNGFPWPPPGMCARTILRSEQDSGIAAPQSLLSEFQKNCAAHLKTAPRAPPFPPPPPQEHSPQEQAKTAQPQQQQQQVSSSSSARLSGMYSNITTYRSEPHRGSIRIKTKQNLLLCLTHSSFTLAPSTHCVLPTLLS